MSDNAQCAHCRVLSRHRRNPSGSTSEWWECDSGCGMRFVPEPFCDGEHFFPKPVPERIISISKSISRAVYRKIAGKFGWPKLNTPGHYDEIGTLWTCIHPKGCKRCSWCSLGYGSRWSRVKRWFFNTALWGFIKQVFCIPTHRAGKPKGYYMSEFRHAASPPGNRVVPIIFKHAANDSDTKRRR